MIVVEAPFASATPIQTVAKRNPDVIATTAAAREKALPEREVKPKSTPPELRSKIFRRTIAQATGAINVDTYIACW